MFVASLFLFIGVFSKAQINLVPNPSFEIYDTCVDGLDQLSRCQGWSSYSESPDYYNTCSTTNGIYPPNTDFAYQYPIEGNAYCGLLFCYHNSCNIPDYRELVGAKLDSSLQIGTKYFISFYLNAGGKVYTVAMNKISILFSTIAYSKINPAPVNNFANFYEDSIYTDTVNWVHLKGSFIADSAYQYIILGNFFADTLVDTINIGNLNHSAYYLFDNVILSTDSTFAYTPVGIIQPLKDCNIQIYPNPFIDILHIKLLNSSFGEVRIENILGQCILKRNMLINIDELILDVSSLKEGVYFILIKTKNELITKKIIKQKK